MIFLLNVFGQLVQIKPPSKAPDWWPLVAMVASALGLVAGVLKLIEVLLSKKKGKAEAPTAPPTQLSAPQVQIIPTIAPINTLSPTITNNIGLSEDGVGRVIEEKLRALIPASIMSDVVQSYEKGYKEGIASQEAVIGALREELEAFKVQPSPKQREPREGQPEEIGAVRLSNAAFDEHKAGRLAEAIGLYSAALRLDPQYSPAYINRGNAYSDVGDTEKSLKDYANAIESSVARPQDVAIALINSAIVKGHLGMHDEAVADATRVIHMPTLPDPVIADALFNRGVSYGELGRAEEEINDYDRVINNASSTSTQICLSLINRGHRLGTLGEYQKEIVDLTNALGLSDVPSDLRAQAHYNRGATYSQLSQWDLALKDYDAVIKLPNAPIDLIALALIDEGLVYGELGEVDNELRSYSLALSIEGVHPHYHAKALTNRGIVYAGFGNFSDAYSDFRMAVDNEEATSKERAKAAFCAGVTAAIQDRVTDSVQWLEKSLDLDTGYCEEIRDSDALKNVRLAPEFKRLALRIEASRWPM